MSDSLLMLLEMIEEALNERRKDNVIKLANKYVKMIKNAGDEYKDAKLAKVPTPRSTTISITNAGSRQQRDTLSKKLKIGKPYIMKDGKIVGGRIPNTTLTIKFLQGSSKGITRLSERFEGNLIKVLNNNSEQEIEHVSEKEFSGIQQIAEKVINDPRSEAITKGSPPWKKPGNGKITEDYAVLDGTRARVNPTPKTDIADSSADFRVSVKKDGAQLLSGQAREVQAITEVVSKKLGYDTEIKKKLIKMMAEKEKIDAMSASERGDLGRQIADELFNNEDFKKQFLLEAMTGNHRFKTEESKANSLLVWDLNGNGYFNPAIGSWVEQNYSQVKYGIRSRGTGRGLAARLDTIAKQFRSIKEQAQLAIQPAGTPPQRTDLGELPPEQEPANLPFGGSLTELQKVIDQLYAETPEPKILNILDVQIVELDFEFMMS